MTTDERMSKVSPSEHRGPEPKTENTSGSRALRDSGKDDVEDFDDEDDSSSGTTRSTTSKTSTG